MAQFDPDAWLNKQRERDLERANLQQQLGTGITPPAQSTFNPDEYLTKPMPVPEAQPVPPEPLNQPVMVPIVPYNPAATGMADFTRQTIEAAKQASGPAVESFKGLGERYMSKAGKPLVDVAAMAAGSPIPPMATYETGRAVVEGVKGILASGKEFADLMRGLPDETVAKMAPLVPVVRDALNGRDLQNFIDLNKKVGIERAIKEFVPSEALAKNADFMSALSGLRTELAAKPSLAARIAGPMLRGAARVAGPAALAYDLYEAYPYYQAANVPERLASGEVKQNMAVARQAQLNMPTPAPLTPQEAANLLASGDRRLIDIYGGVSRLAAQAGQTMAQPEQPSFINQAMQIYNRYRGMPQR